MSRVMLLAATLVLSGATIAGAATDPHQDTLDKSSCLFCHVAGFEAPEIAKSGYTLLESTIDAVCLRCHTKECCAVGQKHMDELFIGVSHPSDVEERDIQRESRPKTLPLQDGKMTCNTCHYHRRPPGKDYKLVRMIEFKSSGVDWTNLCLDCHKEL